MSNETKRCARSLQRLVSLLRRWWRGSLEPEPHEIAAKNIIEVVAFEGRGVLSEHAYDADCWCKGCMGIKSAEWVDEYRKRRGWPPLKANAWLTDEPANNKQTPKGGVYMGQENIEANGPKARSRAAAGYATIVGEALDFVWNDWCGDAGTIPDCFAVHGPKTTRVSASFAGSRFAEQVAERIAARLDEVQSHNEVAHPRREAEGGAQ